MSTQIRKKPVYCIFKRTFYLEQLLGHLRFSAEPCRADGFSWSGLSVPSSEQRNSITRTRHWQSNGVERFPWDITANWRQFKEEQSWEKPAADVSCHNPSWQCSGCFCWSGICFLHLSRYPGSLAWYQAPLPKVCWPVCNYMLSQYYYQLASFSLLVCFFITLIRNSNSHWNTESKIYHICKY